MNSEELEQSLRTEFESYLKTVLGDLKQEAAEFQTKVEAEIDKHKAQLDEAFKAYATRFDSEHTFDEAFRGSVSEHLRLARDEGARITADAMAAAEDLREPGEAAPAPPPVEVKYDQIRDAVKDISTKDSQSAILKALVHNAAEFAPRGAFFIIKNEHFVGWKVFGTEAPEAEEAIREIHFATANDSILGAAVKSSSTVDGAFGDHAEDTTFLDPLHYGEPAHMHAIPLVARGRAVAVLYADHGAEGTDLNLEALETLVSVAGLTVELLAATHTAKTDKGSDVKADFEDAQHESDAGTPAPSAFEHKAEPEHFEAPAPVVEAETFSFSDSVSYQGGFPLEAPAPEYEAPAEKPAHFEAPKFEAPVFEAPKHEEPKFDASAFEVSHFETPKAETPAPFEVERASDTHFAPEPVAEPSFTEYTPVVESSPFEMPAPEFTPAETKAEDTSAAMVFDTGGTIEPAAAEFSPFEQPVEAYEPATVASGGFSKSMDAVSEAPVSVPPKARLSDRPVDLPIEVPEEERRIHNDARRFARLLVSEIKLYNEKKVLEGRQAHDLYERLREAIDRSREMYDKRVQPPVAAKFDYFHYELLNSLADGNEERLGPGYPGASV